MRIGVHVSIAGKIYESVDRAVQLGCDTMQVFSRNPRGWQTTRLEKEDIEEFKKRRREKDIRPAIVHIPYLINLATPDDQLYRKSISSYIEDIERTDLLGAEYFVTHFGSHVGSGEENGIKRFSSALDEIIRKTKPKATILLETTAGSGSWLGYKFEHIRDIVNKLSDKKNVGVCLDTSHIFAAGYDIRTKAGLEDTLKKFDKLLGLRLIKVIHFNDSKALLGSNVDRHEHIGRGEIGLEALSRIINHPKLKDAAFIMETPKKTDKDDRMNMKTARGMVKK